MMYSIYLKDTFGVSFVRWRPGVSQAPHAMVRGVAAKASAENATLRQEISGLDNGSTKLNSAKDLAKIGNAQKRKT